MTIYFDDIQIGAALPTVVNEPLTQIQFVRYSGASGDFNPIRTVEQAGIEAGNNGVIAHGMLVAGLLGRVVTNWIEPRQVRKIAVRFTAISRAGDVITCRGQVVEKFEVAGEARVRGEVEAVDQNGQAKVKGEFIAALPRRVAGKGSS